ncbi:hypothetical protein SNE40_001348 [Patella caerulea]|uniref:E3 ubiquitin-protein ligase LRSAM1 n=1 Tax=Patella caerulea TaxID=87958 RepID=A0AAN8QHY6_PATCE
MHLFRSQSDEAKKRLQHQLYLAQENPEPYIDISGCQISSIPSTVYSTCRVLNKEVLLLHDNWISTLEETGKLTDLIPLRVLDLHNNDIKTLPENIKHLENLQVLNLEGNKLKKLPEEIGDLHNLQTLNVKNNKIHELPKCISGLCRLRTLDISNNEITKLPVDLCMIRTLETLTLDSDHMKHPSTSICEKGTEEIMKTLCNEYGIEYQAPSNFLLNVLDTPKPMSSSWSNNSFKVRKEEVKLLETVEQYQNLADQKHRERVELEKQMCDEQIAQANLANAVGHNKQHLVESITKDQEKIEQELSEISTRKEAERLKLFAELVAVEKSADLLISQLLDINEKAKKTEHMLEIVEKERRAKDDWFVVRWEEVQNLRKRDVLVAMEKMLKESDESEILRQTFTSDREHNARRYLAEEQSTSDKQLQDILHSRDVGQKVLIHTLAQQDELQKQAFEVLQLQKDAKHQRITSEIELIEQELAELSRIERERRDLRAETEMNLLCEKRIALCSMLSQLMSEQEKRQKELSKRLLEMEEQRLDGQTDYWMVQYQRLMDSKPQQLIDQERNLEIAVVKILQKSAAEDYIPVFARHRMTIETMLQLSEDDMKQMGIYELGVRRSILNNIEDYKRHNKTTDKEQQFASCSDHSPSAPPATTDVVSPDEGLSALRRQKSVTARGLHSECAICLDQESQVLFLNCGHVCCCSKCSEPLTECPLCRAAIVQRIRLNLV